jgi:acyl carrier protein
MNDTKQNIRQFVISTFLFGADKGLADNSSFLEEGIIDSTGVLELVAHVEKEFGFKVADTEIIPDNFDSIDAVAQYVERKRRP